MTKIFAPNFILKARVPKNRKETTRLNKVSRKCYAVVITVNNELKACITKSDESKLVIPFTKRSLDLKGKAYVFSKTKDKNNRPIIIIRDDYKSITNCGSNDQYSTLIDSIYIAGYIINSNGKMYFDYTDFVAINNLAPKFNDVNIDENKPLFKE